MNADGVDFLSAHKWRLCFWLILQGINEAAVTLVTKSNSPQACNDTGVSGAKTSFEGRWRCFSESPYKLDISVWGQANYYYFFL